MGSKGHLVPHGPVSPDGCWLGPGVEAGPSVVVGLGAGPWLGIHRDVLLVAHPTVAKDEVLVESIVGVVGEGEVRISRL